MSNLKQLGTAFLLYTSDYDGNLPTPITNHNPLTGEIPPTWVTGDPAKPATSAASFDKGGIYPYVKQRGNGGSSNTFACPDATQKPFSASSVSGYSSPPGQNYVMNQYLQMNWGGLFHATQPFGTQLKAADDKATGFYSPVNPDSTGAPSETILLFEAAQEKDASGQYDATVNRYGTPFYQGFSGACQSYAHDAGGMIPCLQPADYHNDISDFLFLDGHVKGMKPSQTWTADTAKYVNGQAKSNPSAARYYTYQRKLGAGSKDLWNPNLPGTIFP